MENIKRKAMKNASRENPPIGGVFCIQCNANQRRWIKSTVNLPAQQHKYEFAFSIGSCPEPAMRADWLQYGSGSFTFTVLEQLARKATQTEQEFQEDIGVLLALWMDRDQHDA